MNNPLTATTSIRAVPVVFDRLRSLALFRSPLEAPFELRVESFEGLGLGREVDIEVTIERDDSGDISGGTLDAWHPVEAGDPRPAWIEWGKSVGASEWEEEA